MNPLGAVSGLFFGVLAGALINYVVPQLQGDLSIGLTCAGIAFVGWKVSGFLETGSFSRLMYIAGLLVGYFGLPYVMGDIHEIAPLIKPRATEVP